MLGRAGQASQGNKTCCKMTLIFQDAAPVGWILPDLYWKGVMKKKQILNLLAASCNTCTRIFFQKGWISAG